MKKSAPKQIDWAVPQSKRRKGQKLVSVGWSERKPLWGNNILSDT